MLPREHAALDGAVAPGNPVGGDHLLVENPGHVRHGSLIPRNGILPSCDAGLHEGRGSLERGWSRMQRHDLVEARKCAGKPRGDDDLVDHGDVGNGEEGRVSRGDLASALLGRKCLELDSGPGPVARRGHVCVLKCAAEIRQK